MTDTPAAASGAAIRAEAARAGLSLRALARALGRNHTYVTDRAKGVVTCDVNDLVAIARVLGIPVTRLIPSADPAKPEAENAGAA